MFVQQPEGFIKKGIENKTYRLKKALYRLKQAPQASYSKIEAYFAKEHFDRCPSEHTLFIGNILIVNLYVDDIIFIGNSRQIC